MIAIIITVVIIKSEPSKKKAYEGNKVRVIALNHFR